MHGEQGRQQEREEEDPVIAWMAQSVANAFHHPLTNVNATGKGSPNEVIGLDFRLHSFLTRPKATTDLYPRSTLQKQRYDRITVQERLVLLSVCERRLASSSMEQHEASLVPSGAAAARVTNQGGEGGKGVGEGAHDENELQRAVGGTLGGAAMQTGASNTDTTTDTTVAANTTTTATATTTSSNTNTNNTNTNATATRVYHVSPRPMLVAGLEALEYRLYRSSTDNEPATETSTDQQQQNQQDEQTRPQQPAETYEKVVYLAKVDTTGFWPPPDQETPNTAAAGSSASKAAQWRTALNASPAQVLVQAYLEAATHRQEHGVAWLDNKAKARASVVSTLSTTMTLPYHAQTSLYIFARAQPQYLFAKSALNPCKRVLSDRGLVRWWKKMIESTFNNNNNNSNNSNTMLVANWHIPGIDDERLALRSIHQSGDAPIGLTLPSTTDAGFSWQYGPPDCRPPPPPRQAHSSSLSTTTTTTITNVTSTTPRLARDWVPSFPDDPKSRLMQSSPSCRGGQVDLRLFWEIAAISEESGAGKTTGFFRVVQQFPECEQQQQQHQQQEQQRLQDGQEDREGPGVMQAAPKRGGSSSDYTRTINALLSLNFSNPALATESTLQWQQRVLAWRQQELEGSSGGSAKEVGVQENHSLFPPATRTLPSIVKSPTLSSSWIQEHVIQVEFHVPPPSVAVVVASPTVRQQQSISTGTSSSTPQVNVLGAGFVKKGSSSSSTTTTTTGVNVLGAGLIKRKQPPLYISSATTTTTPSASASSVPAPSSTTTLSDGTSVNVLGAGFIKKRKTDP